MKKRYFAYIAVILVCVIVVNHYAMQDPLAFGEEFGPVVHVVSRIFPLSLSDEITTSFQGLEGPRSAPENILVYNITDATPEQEIQARSLQGLMNRDKPTLYLISSEEDVFWLSQIDGGVEYIDELDYSSYPKIKYDFDSRKQTYLAVTLAGVHDAIPVLEAEELLFDLTPLSDDELHDLMLETFQNCSKTMISFRNKETPNHIDFNVKNKVFLSSLAVTDYSFLVQLDRTSPKEAAVMEKIFSQMEPDCAMIGYNLNSGIKGEYETIEYLSDHGCFSVPVPKVPNLSFFSGMPRVEPTHETPSSNIELENKTYVVFIMSDGDNLDLPYSKYESFSTPHETPLAWSISPLLNEFAPTMFEFYSSNMPIEDTFVVAPSGGGFVYPSKNQNLPAFIEHTDRFMKELDLRYVWILDYVIGGYGPNILEQFADISDGVFMEYVILRSYGQSIEMYDETPAIFSAGFVESDRKIAERIVKSTPNQVPAFLFIGMEMRYNYPDHVDSEVAKLDPDQYEVVSVPEFMDLMKQANLPH
jgi:hypothetical protein